MPKAFALLVVSVLFIAGCDPISPLKSPVPPNEDKIARRCLELLASRDFSSVEAIMVPEIVTSDLRKSLVELAASVTVETTETMEIVEYAIVDDEGARFSDLYYQYRLSNGWILANVVLANRDGNLLVAGLNFYRSEYSRAQYAFTFQQKGILHYAIFAIAIFNPMLIIFALFQCIRTPMSRRKWLWIIFILLGVTGVTFDWTTGAINFSPVYVVLLGAGFWKSGWLSPLILTVGFPLGAIIFLLKRKRSLRPPPDDAPLSA